MSRLLMALLLPALVSAPLQAQDRDRDEDVARELLPEGYEDDPIGIGDTHTLREVPTEPEAPPIDLEQPPRAPGVDVTAGAVITAIPGVREVDHRVVARLADGLVEVAVEMRFINRARHRAELRYRLPVPRGARAGSLEVCVEERCRAATPDDSGAYDDSVQARRPGNARGPLLPVAAVDVDETDGEDTALVIRAAPLIPGKTTTLRLHYLAEAATHGGITHLRLPARGQDARIAPAELSFETDELLAPAVDGRPALAAGEGHHAIDPGRPVTLSATVRGGGGPQIALERFPCAEGTCARLHAVAGARSARRERVVLLLDASPSMLGPARGRMGAALATLLGTMAPGTEVRALAFAGEAQPLLEEWTAPDEVPLATLGRAIALDLGSATRFEAAWRASHARRGDHLIIVGDGGLTDGAAALAATEAAREAGVRVSVLNLADRAPRPALQRLVARTRGRIVQAGPEADLAARERTTLRLEEKLVALSAPTVAGEVAVHRPGAEPVRLGALLAGEALRWSGPAPRGTRFVVGSARRPGRGPAGESAAGRALAAMASPSATGRLAAVAEADRARPSLCEDSGPVRRTGGVSSDDAPIVLAEARSCAPPVSPPNPEPGADRSGRGIPAETVLSMLRQRVVPTARRCFRTDRAGRGDYSVRAVFEFELADREVAAASVEGQITDRLKACLLGTLEGLDVPAFRGSVLVRYPVYTERHPPPPTVELRNEVAEPVNRALGTMPAPPPLTP